MRIRPKEALLYLLTRAIKAVDWRKNDLSLLKSRPPKNILVVSSTAIGDTLMSTPAIRAVRRSYRDARVMALLNRSNMELFENNPNIDGVIPYSSGFAGFFSALGTLRKYKFDLVLIFHGNEPETTPLCYLSGAPFIVKLPNKNPFRFLLSNKEPVLGWEDLGHGIWARIKAAETAGCEAEGVRMDLFIESKEWSETEMFLRREGIDEGSVLIGFQPGASTLSRRWFPDRFVELGKLLLMDNPRFRIILTGSPDERPLCEDIAKAIGDRTVVAAGAISLKKTPPLIKRLNVLVTGDTGPMHIAYTVGTPVVALYAVSDPKRTGPLYDVERHRIIKKERTCDPCVSKKCEYQECMEAITVYEVREAIKDALGSLALAR